MIRSLRELRTNETEINSEALVISQVLPENPSSSLENSREAFVDEVFSPPFLVRELSPYFQNPSGPGAGAQNLNPGEQELPPSKTDPLARKIIRGLDGKNI